jgi:pimeloyl-ACP methyl ester carboxylesterase
MIGLGYFCFVRGVEGTVRITAVIADFARKAVNGEVTLACGSRLNVSALVVCVGLGGCAFSRQETPPAVMEPGQRGVVIVVDGAGDFRATSDAVQKAVEKACLPLEVVSVDWSHGFGRVVADHTDWQHSQEEGLRLAGQIVSYRQACPERALHLIAHSAGSAVALSAAAAVPAGTIDRLILLAPSVSTQFDVRPALRGTREGIDVFYSSRDVFSLGIAVAMIGTADGCRGCQAAGRFGFQAQPETPEDVVLYAKLRQHPWERCVLWTGNLGHHSGTKHQRFLHAYILPLLDAGQNGAMPEGYSTSAGISAFGP